MSLAQNRPLTKPLFYTKTAQPLYFIPLASKNFFRCVKFWKLIPTAKPMGKEVFTSRNSLVKLPKFMHNERNLSPVINHNRNKESFAALTVPPWVSSDSHQNVKQAPSPEFGLTWNALSKYSNSYCLRIWSTFLDTLPIFIKPLQQLCTWLYAKGSL